MSATSTERNNGSEGDLIQCPDDIDRRDGSPEKTVTYSKPLSSKERDGLEPCYPRELSVTYGYRGLDRQESSTGDEEKKKKTDIRFGKSNVKTVRHLMNIFVYSASGNLDILDKLSQMGFLVHLIPFIVLYLNVAIRVCRHHTYTTHVAFCQGVLQEVKKRCCYHTRLACHYLPSTIASAGASRDKETRLFQSTKRYEVSGYSRRLQL